MFSEVMDTDADRRVRRSISFLLEGGLGELKNNINFGMQFALSSSSPHQSSSATEGLLRREDLTNQNIRASYVG